MPWREWVQERPGWSRELGIAENVIEPGLDIGPAMGAFRRAPKGDFVFPWLGPCWVNERVRSAVEANDVTGSRFEGGAVRQSKGGGSMYEWIFAGEAWQLGHTAESIRVCEICGRTGPMDSNLVVDVSRWDGSDCFNLDGYQTVRIVTERVADIIHHHQFTNVRLIAVQSSEEIVC